MHFLTISFLKGNIEEVIFNVRKTLDRACRPMEIYTTWYPQKDGEGKTDKLIEKYVDGLTIWTWNFDYLVNLEEVLNSRRRISPTKKLLCGQTFFSRPLDNEFGAEDNDIKAKIYFNKNKLCSNDITPNNSHTTTRTF